ncbi:hypothetical protein O181_022663 [Austropuccinia psidii MF-1]|uniref:Integrase zinc-binding domain-containing protein n=1 Tax=Austropuccinia psidii MF-1 TaxID=1389203 RepID=A0A9Q3GWK1_9BASI|nr:hypothetical protein [Austropuccinia psidii MF-1]
MDGILHQGENHTSALIVIERENVPLILQECHDCPYMEHMSEDRKKERIGSKAWWPQWEKDDRNPKFTLELWTNLYDLLGTQLAFSTDYCPKTNELAGMMIQTMEEIIRRFYAYGMEYKDHEGYTYASYPTGL